MARKRCISSTRTACGSSWQELRAHSFGRQVLPNTGALLDRTIVNARLRVTLLIAACSFDLLSAIPTLTYESPQPLTAGGSAIELGNHAAPRLVDWNSDGVLDLLVGGGDGYIWLFLQNQPTNSSDFLAGVRVNASGTAIRVGTGYTGACFADIDGDGKPDLIAAGNDRRIRCYLNTGTAAAPAFSSLVVVPGGTGEFVVPANVNGRIDIADWDGDGKLDLLTGEFEGYVTWYRNTGTASAPAFGAPGIRLERDGAVIHEPYNTHPRVFDFNQDGLPDLAYGINWGYVKILINTEGLAATNFISDYLLRDTSGAVLNIRALNNDDTTPDFADLNGDGILDLISGGLNGKLFIMPGVPHSAAFESIESIMAAHPTDLGAALNASASLRETLFGLHRSLRVQANSLLPLADRQSVRDWYLDHIARYPQYLTKRRLDQTADAYVPYLAGQVWVNLFESMPDTPEHRLATANAAGLSGTHFDLLMDLGMLYIDNSRSTAASQRALYDIAASIPASLQIVETVTQNDFLKTATGGSVNLESHHGVNVFAQVGDYSEGFPPDVPQTLIDGFCAVVAHELNHNVEIAAARLYPWYYDRKYDLLEQAAPPHLVFKDRHFTGYGLDLSATQANFLAHGFWDGVAAHWTAAYDDYWASGPGAGFDRHWLRDNLKFCIDAPQEAFATLANQYFTSSEVMLQLAIARWQQGISHGLDQFLFVADVYSLDSDHTFFYRVDTAARVTETVIPIHRNANWRIDGLTTTATRYEFLLDSEGTVMSVVSNSIPVSAHPIPDPDPITYGSAFDFQLPPDAFMDPDHDPLSFTATGTPEGITFDSATQAFSGAPLETGLFPVAVIASDDRTPDLTATNTFTITVKAASLTVTADSKTKAYGESDPPFSVSYNGFVQGENQAVLEGALIVNRLEGENVGAYLVTPGGLTSSNYAITFNTGTLTITQATLAVSADARTKLYGETDPELSFAVSGLQFSDSPTSVLTGALMRAPGETVAGSPYPISQGTLSANDNYSIFFTGNALTISPVPLTVTADSKTKAYGESDPPFSVSYNGFVQGEDQAVLEGALIVNRVEGENVGAYLVTPGGLTSSNYAITFNSGTLTILAAPAPRILAVTGAGTDTVMVYWTAVSNVTYRVKYKPGLNVPWEDLESWITASNEVASTIDHPAGATQRFYQVIIWPLTLEPE
jgi:hypothetical protein